MRIRALDSHTEGEPTRVLIEGVPDLGGGTVAEQADTFARDHDHLRRAVVQEPRGSDVLVAALLLPSVHTDADIGVLFVNNAGVLGMCVHGTIGVVRTLRELDRMPACGSITLETNVGLVRAAEHEDGSISVENVASHRSESHVPVELEGRTVHADIAWGGNWFALVDDHGLEITPANIEQLRNLAWSIRKAINRTHPDIDHIELYGEASQGADSRSFVLCPGGEYDRSPCGTGTSAKIACLAADGALAQGQPWIQESVIGSRFTATYRMHDHAILPTIQGRAWITAELDLRFDDTDPFRHGIAHE